MPDVIIGKDAEAWQDIIRIGDIERRSGLYILGVQGTGKTTLIKNIITQDIVNGQGVFFLDPHGDAIEDLQQCIPRWRQDDVIILDPTHETHAFGINLLECRNLHSLAGRERIFGRALDIFTKLYANPQTGHLDVWLDKYLRNSFYPLIANQGYTLTEIPLFLTDRQFRDRLLQHPLIAREYPEVVRFWHTEFARLSPTDQQNEITSTLTRLGAFSRPYIKHLIGQSKTTLSFTKIMDTGKILFIKLSANIAPDLKRIIGTILISDLVHAVLLRDLIPAADERRHFCIFVDEFQNFASSDDFAVLFTQARKYAIATTIAHQERYGQFADNKRISGATDAAVNKIFFQVSGKDGEEQAATFAQTASDTKTLLGGELVLSPHPIEDMWERGHPEDELIYIRDRYFWIVDALRSKPQEQYFLFDRSRIKYDHGEVNLVNFRFEDFADWEWYRSSPDDLRRGISLLNQYYYDWMRGKYDPAKPITDTQLQLMLSVIECLGGVFGFLPMYRPYIPEPMRQALFRVLAQYRPRYEVYKSYVVSYDRHGSARSEERLIDSEIKRTINDPAFPRVLLPYKPPLNYDGFYHIDRREERWRPGHPLREEEYYRRLRLCHYLIGIKSPVPLCKGEFPSHPGYVLWPSLPTWMKLEGLQDIPTTFPDTTLYHGIRQLAAYIGMPPHELENLIAWEPRPLTSEEKDALINMVKLHAKKIDRASYEQKQVHIHQQFATAFGKFYSEDWVKKDNVKNRLIWQMGELVYFVGMCLKAAPRWLAHWPVKLQSGRYEDTPKREKTQGEMIDEMALTLMRLPPRTAYAKVVSSTPGQERMWMGKIVTFKDAPVAGADLVDAKRIAWLNALDLNGGILKKRSVIEAEIRDRQERWRGGGGNEPPPNTTGGNNPPTLPPGGTGQAGEPPPPTHTEG